MNLTERLTELQQTLKECEETEKLAHQRAIELRRKISRLNTVIRDAEDIFEPSSSAESLQEVSENLK